VFSTAKPRRTVSTSAATDEVRTGWNSDADAIISKSAGNTTALSAEATVELAFAAVTACAGGNDDAISRCHAIEPHVGCSGASLSA
jgi:hypothetical protein